MFASSSPFIPERSPTGRVTTTVLFTDIVGSIELRARLGEQAADELRRRLARQLSLTPGR